jgi:hypothetical protein
MHQMDGTRSYHYEARSIAFTCQGLFPKVHRSPLNCGSMPISTSLPWQQTDFGWRWKAVLQVLLISTRLAGGASDLS